MTFPFIIALFTSFIIGILVGMILHRKGATVANVLALIVSCIWLGIHVASWYQNSVVPSLPYIFNVVGAMAIATSMGFKLTDVTDTILSRIKPKD